MSMYNIYVEGQQRDAYVARKAVEKYAAERDEKEQVERRDKALKSRDHTAHHNAWMKVIDHNDKMRDQYARQEDSYKSDAAQYKDYKIDAMRSGDEESEEKYRDLQRKADNNSINTWVKKMDTYSRDKRPAIDAILKKQRKDEKKHKHESGIFAECVLI